MATKNIRTPGKKASPVKAADRRAATPPVEEAPPVPEQSADRADALGDLGLTRVGEWLAAAERCGREEPVKCAGAVVAIGVLTSVVPFGRLCSLLVTGVFAIMRPLLIVAGVMKVLEEIERRRS